MAEGAHSLRATSFGNQAEFGIRLIPGRDGEFQVSESQGEGE